MARTQDEIIKDLRNVECGLSPENLHCDGEISVAQARVKERKLLAQREQLVKELRTRTNSQRTLGILNSSTSELSEYIRMANQWVVLLSSDEYGTEHYLYDTPTEQIEGATRLLKSAQKHGTVDTVRRTVTLIPDPYRGKQSIEEFIEAYQF